MKKYSLLTMLTVGIAVNMAHGQQVGWTLDKAISSALENNNLVKIKDLQIKENTAKIKEAEIKKYPILNVDATYQYNVNVGTLTVPQGSFGALPLGNTTVALPDVDRSFQLGNHNTFNTGVVAYQPITQLGKIKTGIDVAKADVKVSALEKIKAEAQIKNGVEQLYYGILAVRKRMLEAEKNIEVAKLKLYDVTGAVTAGKTIDVNVAGLNANIANEEQELLKLKFQEEDFLADFKKLTGITSEQIVLEEEAFEISAVETLAGYKNKAEESNLDIKLTQAQLAKSELGIKAAKQSNLPEVGVMAGYTYQLGNLMFPNHNPYVGLKLKWGIQDLFSNKQIEEQRKLLQLQASENEQYTKLQTSVSIEKSYRKFKQSQELITVAEKALMYRKQELAVEQDRKDAGLNTPIKIAEIEAAVAKAEADLYGAKMSFKVAQSELNLILNQ